MRECECHRTWARTPNPCPSEARDRRSRAAGRSCSRGLALRRALPSGPVLGLGALAARAMLAGLLAELETLLQPRHEIDHRRRLAFLGFGHFELFPLEL